MCRVTCSCFETRISTIHLPNVASRDWEFSNSYTRDDSLISLALSLALVLDSLILERYRSFRTLSRGQCQGEILVKEERMCRAVAKTIRPLFLSPSLSHCHFLRYVKNDAEPLISRSNGMGPIVFTRETHTNLLLLVSSFYRVVSLGLSSLSLSRSLYFSSILEASGDASPEGKPTNVAFGGWCCLGALTRNPAVNLVRNDFINVYKYMWIAEIGKKCKTSPLGERVENIARND